MQIEYFKCFFIIIILFQQIWRLKQTYGHISNIKQRGLKDQLQKTNSKSRNDYLHK